MRAKLVAALVVAVVLGVAGLAETKIGKVSYDVLPGAPGYLLLVIKNIDPVLSLNKFGISLSVEGEVTGALALQGTGPAVIEGGPMYWVVLLPGAGLASNGILLVSVKVPAGVDLKAAVVRVVGYKVS